MGLLRRLRNSFRAKRRRSGDARVTFATPSHNGTTTPVVGNVTPAQVAAAGGSQPTTAASSAGAAVDGARSGAPAAGDVSAFPECTISEITLPQLVLVVRQLQTELRELRQSVGEIRRSVLSQSQATAAARRAAARSLISVDASRNELFFDALSASLYSLEMRGEKPQLNHQMSLPASDSAATVAVMKANGEKPAGPATDAMVKENGTAEPVQNEQLPIEPDKDKKDTHLPNDESLPVNHTVEQTEPHAMVNGDVTVTSTEADADKDQPGVQCTDTADTAIPATVAPSMEECHGECRHLGHPLAEEMERVVSAQLALAASDVDDGSWSLFAQDGQMRMYRQEAPADNYSVDPLKAVHQIGGVTARELCRHYWEPDVRLEWENTVDRVTVLARPDPSTLLVHQVHKRIWPAQQRDTVFWSHLCRRRVAGVEWSIAVNHSVHDHPLEPRPPPVPGCVRAVMTSCLAAHSQPQTSGDGDTQRPELTCQVSYSSHVEPGGWAPTAGLRLVYRREYPRFLKTFTKYVTNKCQNEPIQW